MLKPNYYVRLPLKNAYNVRELGGYPCEIGAKITKYHSFLRSDDLYLLNQDDIDYLLEYGLRAVIDLRSLAEVEKYPDPFEKIKGVNYKNIPLVINAIDDITKQAKRKETILIDFYFALIDECKVAIKEIFEFIATNNTCILFHCAAGKDRTGMIAMLLLLLAGVSEADVIANYSVTEIYNNENPIFEKLKEEYQEELLRSKSEFIKPVIQLIFKKYGNCETFLKQIRISEHCIASVKEKLA